MLGVSPRSLVRNHGPSLIRGRAERRLKLRQKQTEIALGGNVSMLIWLGKNELGQMEPRAAVEHSGPGGTPLAANVHVYMPSNNR